MSDWQADYQHGTFVVWPTGEIEGISNELRQTYDPESQAHCPAHITVTQPFLEAPSAESWRQIETIVSSFSTFPISVGPIEPFGASTTLKFDIEPKAPLRQLRRKLHETGLFNLTLPFTEGFIPHMTISEFGLDDRTVVECLAATLNQEISSHVFSCRALAYIRPDSNFQFQEVRCIPLGNR